MNVFELYGTLNLDDADFKKSLERVERQASSSSNNMSRSFAAAGAALTGAFAAVGVGALARDIIRTGASFEASMQGVLAVTAGAEKSFANLRDLAAELGSTTAFSASQAAEGIEMLGRNGLTASQILDGAAEASLTLAAATGTDLANAGNIATDVMAAFGVEASELTTVIDGITGVTTSSKFGIDDYRLALANAGGVAGSVGVELEDFNTTIALMSPAFSSGQDAGTAFKTMLQRLNPTSKEAGEMMQQLGLNFFDAQGNILPMRGIVEQLETSFSGLSEEQKLNAASTIFGADAMRGALAVAEGGVEAYDRLAESVGSANAELQADIRLDSLQGSITRFQSALEGLQLSIYNAGMGTMVRAAVDTATAGVVGLTNMVRGATTTAQQFGQTYGEVFAAVGTLIGNFYGNAGAVVDAFGDVVVEELSGMGSAVADTFAEFGNIPPIRAAFEFVSNIDETALVVARGAYDFVASGESQVLTATFGFVSDVADAAWQQAQDVWAWFTERSPETLEAQLEFASTFVPGWDDGVAALEWFNGLSPDEKRAATVAFLTNIDEQVYNLAVRVWEWLTNLPAVTDIAATVSAHFDLPDASAITSTLGDLLGNMSAAVEGVSLPPIDLSNVDVTLPDFGSLQTRMRAGVASLSNALDGVGLPDLDLSGISVTLPNWDTISENVRTGAASIAGVLGDISLPEISISASAINDADLRASLEQTISGATTFVQGRIDAASFSFDGFSSLLSGDISGALGSFERAVVTATSSSRTAFVDLTSGVGDLMGTLSSHVADVDFTALELPDSVTTSLESLRDIASSNLENLGTVISDAGEGIDVFSDVLAGFSANGDNVASALGAVEAASGTAWAAFNPLWTSVITEGSTFNTLLTGTAEALGTIGGISLDAFTITVGNLEAPLGAISQLLAGDEDFWDALYAQNMDTLNAVAPALEAISTAVGNINPGLQAFRDLVGGDEDLWDALYADNAALQATADGLAWLFGGATGGGGAGEIARQNVEVGITPVIAADEAQITQELEAVVTGAADALSPEAFAGVIDSFWVAARNADMEGAAAAITENFSAEVIAGLDNNQKADIELAINELLVAAGQMGAAGLSEGMLAELPNVAEAARQLGLQIPQTVEDILEIRSPSRVLTYLGLQSGYGLAAGMMQAVPEIETASINAVMPATIAMGDMIAEIGGSGDAMQNAYTAGLVLPTLNAKARLEMSTAELTGVLNRDLTNIRNTITNIGNAVAENPLLQGSVFGGGGSSTPPPEPDPEPVNQTANAYNNLGSSAGSAASAVDAAAQALRDADAAFSNDLQSRMASFDFGFSSAEQTREELEALEQTLLDQARALFDAGETGTEAYRQLSSQLGRVQTALGQVNDEIERSQATTEEFLSKLAIQAETGSRSLDDIAADLIEARNSLRQQMADVQEGGITSREELQQLEELRGKLGDVEGQLRDVVEQRAEQREAADDAVAFADAINGYAVAEREANQARAESAQRIHEAREASNDYAGSAAELSDVLAKGNAASADAIQSQRELASANEQSAKAMSHAESYIFSSHDAIDQLGAAQAETRQQIEAGRHATGDYSTSLGNLNAMAAAATDRQRAMAAAAQENADALDHGRATILSSLEAATQSSEKSLAQFEAFRDLRSEIGNLNAEPLTAFDSMRQQLEHLNQITVISDEQFELLTEQLNDAEQAAQDANFEDLANQVERLGGEAPNQFERLIDKVKQAGDEGKITTEQMDELVASLEQMDAASQATDRLVGDLKTIQGGLSGLGATIGDLTGGGSDSAFDFLGASLDGIIGKISEAGAGAFGVADAFGAIAGAAQSSENDAVKAIGGIAQAAMSFATGDIIGGIMGGLQAIGSIFSIFGRRSRRRAQEAREFNAALQDLGTTINDVADMTDSSFARLAAGNIAVEAINQANALGAKAGKEFAEASQERINEFVQNTMGAYEQLGVALERMPNIDFGNVIDDSELVAIYDRTERGGELIGALRHNLALLETATAQGLPTGQIQADIDQITADLTRFNESVASAGDFLSGSFANIFTGSFGEDGIINAAELQTAGEQAVLDFRQYVIGSVQQMAIDAAIAQAGLAEEMADIEALIQQAMAGDIDWSVVAAQVSAAEQRVLDIYEQASSNIVNYGSQIFPEGEFADAMATGAEQNAQDFADVASGFASQIESELEQLGVTFEQLNEQQQERVVLEFLNEDMLEQLADSEQDISDVINAVGTSTADSWEEATEMAADALSKFGLTLEDLSEEEANKVIQSYMNIGDASQEGAQIAQNGLSNLASGLSDAIRSVAEGGSMADASAMLEQNFRTYIIDTIIQQASQAIVAASTVGERLAQIPNIIQQAIGSGDWSGLSEWINETLGTAMGGVEGAAGAIAEGLGGQLGGGGSNGGGSGGGRERPRFGSDAYSGGAGGAPTGGDFGVGGSGKTAFGFDARKSYSQFATQEIETVAANAKADTFDFIGEGHARTTDFTVTDKVDVRVAVSEALEERYEELAKQTTEAFEASKKDFEKLIEASGLTMGDFDQAFIDKIAADPEKDFVQELGQLMLEEDEGLREIYGKRADERLDMNLEDKFDSFTRDDHIAYLSARDALHKSFGIDQRSVVDAIHQTALKVEEDAVEFENKMQASQERMAKAIGDINSSITSALQKAARSGDFESARQELLDNFDEKLGDGIIQAAMQASEAHEVAAKIMAEMPRLLAEAAETGDYSPIAEMANRARESLGEQFDQMQGEVTSAFAAAGLQIPGVKVEVDEDVDTAPTYAAVQDALDDLGERLNFSVQDAFAGGRLNASAEQMVLDYRRSVIDKVRQMALDTALASTVVGKEMAALEPLISQALETGDWSAVNAEVNGIADGMQSALNNVHEQVTGAINGLDGISLADFLEEGASAISHGYGNLEGVIANAEQRLAELLQDDNLNASEMFRELATSVTDTITQIQAASNEGLDTSVLEQQLASTLQQVNSFAASYADAQGFLRGGISQAYMEAVNNDEVGLADAAAILEEQFQTYVIQQLIDMATQTLMANEVVSEQMATLPHMMATALKTGNWSDVKTEIRGVTADLKRQIADLNSAIAEPLQDIFGVSANGRGGIGQAIGSEQSAAEAERQRAAAEARRRAEEARRKAEAERERVMGLVENARDTFDGIIADNAGIGFSTTFDALGDGFVSLTDQIEDRARRGLNTEQLEEDLQDSLEQLRDFGQQYSQASGFIGNEMSSALIGAINGNVTFDEAAEQMQTNFRQHIIRSIADMAIETAMASSTLAAELTDLQPMMQEALATGDFTAVEDRVASIAQGMQEQFAGLSAGVGGALERVFSDNDVVADMTRNLENALPPELNITRDIRASATVAMDSNVAEQRKVNQALQSEIKALRGSLNNFSAQNMKAATTMQQAGEVFDFAANKQDWSKVKDG